MSQTNEERQGRVVVVTGASAGIGRASAIEFGHRGDRVALLARGEEGLKAAARDVEAAGGTAVTVPVDVADADAVEVAAQLVEDEFGPIDVWVNVAFTSVLARAWDVGPAEFRRVIEVNYLGYVHGTLTALRRMMPRDAGTIVQVGSALAYRGIPLQSAYSASKHAIQGFHEALRCELLNEGSNVAVTMPQLPGTNTPQFDWVLMRLPRRAQPVPPIYQPEIGARAVAYAADHPRRREYWVGGSTVKTLLGDKFAPGLLDRYLARKGVAAQQTSESLDPENPANLWEPVDGSDGHDYGAHGRFDDRARTNSVQLWTSQHHGVLGVAGAGAAVTLAAGLATVLARRKR